MCTRAIRDDRAFWVLAIIHKWQPGDCRFAGIEETTSFYTCGLGSHFSCVRGSASGTVDTRDTADSDLL